jgi:hypothetical protein
MTKQEEITALEQKQIQLQQQANFELGRIAGRIELLKEQIKAEAEEKDTVK